MCFAGEAFGEEFAFIPFSVEAAIQASVDAMARFLQEHLADQEGAGAIGDPVAIDVDAFGAGMSHCGIGASSTIELLTAAQLNHEAKAITA